MFGTKNILKDSIEMLYNLNKLDIRGDINAINKILKCNERKASINSFKIELLIIETVHLKLL